MKPTLLLSLAALALSPLASFAQPTAQPSAPPPAAAPASPPALPQLVLNGDQWVIQVPANTPVPRNIVLQLATPTNQPQPVVVLQQPAAPAAIIGSTQPQEVYASAPPPAAVEEVIPVAPDRWHVWIAGHWEWHHHEYVWIHGHWERPPYRDARWHPARWEFRAGRYVYIEGHW